MVRENSCPFCLIIHLNIIIMERYDYYENVLADVKEFINERGIESVTEENKDDLYEELYDDMFVSDSVTGNASGSYTFNTWKAEENLCHNMDLLKEALEEFGCGIDYLERGAEACDVTIRCYLLSQCLSKALDEMEED